MKHINHIFEDLPLSRTKEVQEIDNYFCHATKKGKAHLLVVAQTLIETQQLKVITCNGLFNISSWM